MSEHTKGPWKADGDMPEGARMPGYTYVRSESRDGTGDAIARVCCRTSLNEGNANAHLVAASPDLLQASSNLVDYLASWTDVDLPDGFKLLVALRAAIDKAEG